MKNSIDVRKLLLVFNKVMAEGDNRDGKRYWQGLHAWTDFDGYTCYLCDGRVTVTIFFHNKYDIEFYDAAALSQFERNIIDLAMSE